ncbi:unnamed protein product [Zymoseptoria tritici ST99CH_1E4]|uniref:FHA domain-containing protein n=1 Tax=Zymoseptoria tritici ST99CH_1E4 TaxID=1276532 RepID=A0A2H1GAF8_ZYMTR|nr:unnamed protein product [Zymoseptoria tritici ST99CH_1E4]
MWLLSCDGQGDSNIFGGKQLWLRPGSKHLLGRTSAKTDGPERVQYINHKSVSRKHLLLSVANVQPGDATRLNARLTVTATDASKTGTYINGDKLIGASKTLEGQNYTIKLGSWESTFQLEWRPVVLSFSGVSKSAQAAGKALAEEREKLEAAGVKLSTQYISNTTTHVVAQKRNTALGLQGLVQGRWLVEPSFVDALASACTRTGKDDNGESLSLEDDFKTNWPDETEHTIRVGNEPVPRPDDWLKPNPARLNVFENFTFLFLSPKQHELLLPAISSGGGKAVAFHFQHDTTTKDEVIDFVKELAGQKSARSFVLSQENGPGGIVVVRADEKSAGRNNDLMASIDLALDQRSVEQNELLDVILSNDASVLRRPLRDSTQSVAASPRPEGDPAASAAASRTTRQQGRASVVPESPTGTMQPPDRTAEENRNTGAAEDAEPEVPVEQMTALQRLRLRQAERSRAKTRKPAKLNAFDESQVVPPSPDSPEPESQPTQRGVSNTQRSVREAEKSMRIDSQPKEPQPTQQNARKRAAPETIDDFPDETNEEMMDRILPGPAAFKRQKTAALARNSSSVEPKEKAEKAKKGKEDPKAAGKKGAKQETELQQQMRAAREKEDAERRKDEEALREMQGTDISKIPIEHKIETFDLPVRAPRESTTATGEGRNGRWNPAWDGRANFKKFRPKNARQNGEGAQVRAPTVTITLEEVPGRGHGLGDEYWVQPQASKSKSKSQSQSQSQAARSSAAAAGIEDDDPLTMRRRVRTSRQQDQEAATIEEDGFEEAATSQSTLRGDSSGARPSSGAAAKRPATTQAGGAPPAKKARQTTAARPPRREVSDDDDPLAFKRKRR